MRTVFFILLLLTTSLACAKTYISADRYLDVESGQYVNHAVLVIEAGRIKTVQGDLGNMTAQDRHIDLAGLTLLPGLIDMHVHITRDTRLQGYAQLGQSDMRLLLVGVRNARDMLRAGVTTIRNLGSDSYGDVALRDAISDGDVAGPRIFASGPSLGITGGHCDSNWLPRQYNVNDPGVADGPWQVAARVRENIKWGSDVIKFCATGGVMSKGTSVGIQQYTLEEMQVIVNEAHRRDRTVAAHAHGTTGIKAAIEAGVDSVEHASFIDDEGIRMAKHRGTFLSMDIYVTEFILGRGAELGIAEESLAKERQTGQVQRQNFTRAVNAGVNMVLGTDAGIFPHRESPRQLARMVQFGMTPAQALQAATINGATLLRQQDNLGSLAAGKHADIIAVKGDPLEDVSVVEDVQFVMKGGQVFRQPQESICALSSSW